MMVKLLAFFLLTTLSCFASGFNFNTDTLCFKNSDDDLSEAHFLLGKFGEETGVCQGMSGIVAAFQENVIFRKSRDKNYSYITRLKIDKAISLHSGGCKKKISINGYANLKELCRAYRMFFLNRATSYNASIAINEISFNTPELFTYQDHPLYERYEIKRLKEELQSIIDIKYAKKRNPLILFYKHVTMVHKITKLKRKKGGYTLKLYTYDPNDSSEKVKSYDIDKNGTPVKGQQMIWDVTPNRFLNLCI